MKVKFLAHSGFYIELENTVLIFDWWKGTLPILPNKRILVFASHHHPDHFDPQIFSLMQPEREICFLLGKDIRLAPSNRRCWGVTEEIAERCIRLGGFRQEEPVSGIMVETLPSTDAGVAFLVTTEGKTIYHAGDLNWWHWAGESDLWNIDMERNFKHYMEPLRNRKIDLAMIPLDSRLQESESKGLAYLLEIAQVTKVLPMHQWEDYTSTKRFIQKFPYWQNKILEINQPGQWFTLP